MNNKVSFGVFILTRDSSANIQAALNSVSPFVNQIVVVDTGSLDDTASKAIRSGAEVYFFEWIDDFSAARNYALQLLHTDWVLMLDSDELLSNFDSNLFSQIASNPSLGGINLVINNSLSNDGEQTLKSHRYTRIFRNHPKLRFTGRIHEQIRSSIEAEGFNIYESDFSILHLGYDSYNEEKNKRNLQLLTHDSIDNPNDDWLRFHLAETHFAAGRFDEAAPIYSAISDSNQLNQDQSEMSKLRLAQIALRIDDYGLILELTSFLAISSQNEALRNYIRGTAFLFLKRADESIECFEKCLRINSPILVKKDIESALNVALSMIR